MYLVKANYNETALIGFLIILASNYKPMLKLSLSDYNYDVDACEKHAFEISNLLNS